MPIYDALSALPNGEPSPWGDPIKISYEQRDVLLYAVGIGSTDLRFTYEGTLIAVCFRRSPFAGVV